MLEKLLELLWYVEDFFEDLILLLATPFMYIFTFIQTMWEYRNNPDPEYWERKVEEDQKEIARLTRELLMTGKRILLKRKTFKMHYIPLR